MLLLLEAARGMAAEQILHELLAEDIHKFIEEMEEKVEQHGQQVDDHEPSDGIEYDE
jgi:hypothetical protein